MSTEIVRRDDPDKPWLITRCSHPAPTDPCRACDVESREAWHVLASDPTHTQNGTQA